VRIKKGPAFTAAPRTPAPVAKAGVSAKAPIKAPAKAPAKARHLKSHKALPAHPVTQ
jgi:hypothetical protein